MHRARAWGRVTVGLSVLAILCHLLLILALANRRSVVADLLSRPDAVSVERADRSDQLVLIGVVLALVAAVTAWVAFVAWMYSCARVVDSHVPDALRHRPGWAIGSWFVPFLNLVRPPQIVADLWRTESRLRGGRERITLIGWWWALFITGFVLDRLDRSGQLSTLSAYRAADMREIFYAVVESLGLLLAVLVVLRTTARVEHAVNAEPDAAGPGWTDSSQSLRPSYRGVGEDAGPTAERSAPSSTPTEVVDDFADPSLDEKWQRFVEEHPESDR